MKKSVLAGGVLLGALVTAIVASIGPGGAFVSPDEIRIYVTSTSGGTVSGISFADEDLLVYDLDTETWAMAFDGSDVGLGTADIDAVHVRNEVDPLIVDLSFASPRNLTGVGQIDDSDVVRFTGVGGPNTSGTFELVIDGSDIGLTTAAEDIDAIIGETTLTRYFLSTSGTANVPPTFADEDLFQFTATTTGPTTTGSISPSMFFDGSDQGLSSEDVSGASGAANVLFLSALGNWTIDGIAADRDDILALSFGIDPLVPDPQPIDAIKVFDGDLVGFGSEQINGFSVILGDPPEIPAVDLTVVFGPVPPGPFVPGDVVPLVAVVSHSEDLVDLEGVVLELVEPPGLSLDITSHSCTATPEGWSCPLDPLSSGTLLVVQMDATVEPGVVGIATVEARVDAPALDPNPGDDSDVADIEIAGPPVEPGLPLYLSSSTGGTVGGVTFADEDIVRFDPDDESWSMAFDGSDVGLGPSDINGFAIVSHDPMVIDFTLMAPRNIAGIGLVDDSDMLRFVGVGGPDTSGELSFIFDGSDVDLFIPSEDLDAIDVVTSCASYVFSTLGNFDGTPLAARDEDYVDFSATSMGETTAGSFELVFDGSDVGLAVRDVVGVTLDEVNELIYGAGLGNYTVDGFRGDRNDVWVFGGTFGADTSGTAVQVFDGDLHGYGSEQIDGLHVDLPPFSEEGEPQLECGGNQPPVIVEPSINESTIVEVPENTTAVTDVETVDEDIEDGGLVYGLTTTLNGIDNNAFNLSPLTGVLTFKQPPDFENPTDASVDGGDDGQVNTYEVEVTVTDSGGLTDVILITVQVTDVASQANIEVIKSAVTNDGSFASTDPENPVQIPVGVENGFSISLRSVDGMPLEVVVTDPAIGLGPLPLSIPDGSLNTIGTPFGLFCAEDGPWTNTAVVVATDSAGESVTVEAPLYMLCVSDAPEITSPDSVSVPEGQTVVPGIVDAIDDVDSEGPRWRADLLQERRGRRRQVHARQRDR